MWETDQTARSAPVDVLVAEDSRVQAEVLRRRLLDKGYQVRVAVNGNEAVKLIRERKPSVLISDIEMPEMDGYELCRCVKNDASLRDIPVILLSTLSDPEDIIRGLHSGADNYVTKPYEPQYLIGRVESLLATPVGAADQQPGLEVILAGKSYFVQAGRQQAINLLVSTFENAVEKNRELILANESLTVAQDQLEQRNRELTELNRQLLAANERMKRDLEAGAVVQQSLLPTSLPRAPGLQFAWKFLPCDELAGDFLNVFRLDDRRIGMYVVDVSGHGVPAALLSVTISRVLTPMLFFSSLLLQPEGDDGRGRQVTQPGQVAAELNRRFQMEMTASQYFTIIYAVLDTETRQLQYASAGQPPIVLLREGADPQLLPTDGYPMGWFPDAVYEERSVALQPGDRLWFYSDGVPEAMNAYEEMFGQDRMVQQLCRTRGQSLEESLSQLINEINLWCVPRGLRDDVSVLGLEVTDSG